MKLPKGTEQMIFCNAHYKINEHENVFYLFEKLAEKEMFIIDEYNPKKKEMIGCFVRDYPKNHWNPASKNPGAKQVLGNIRINEGNLVIESRTKSQHKVFKSLVEEFLKYSIKFEKEDFMNPMDMIK